MKDRPVFCFLAFAVLLSHPRALAQALVPNADELSRAPLVLLATAERQLKPSEWLFTGVRVVGQCGYDPVLPRNAVGWWSVRPLDAKGWQWTPYFPPAPQNAALLKAGGAFILLAEENYHLLAVYPCGYGSSGPASGVGPCDIERRACYARRIRETVDGFFQALADADWGKAARAVSDRIREQLAASKSPGEFFTCSGLLPLAKRYSERLKGRTPALLYLAPPMTILSLGDDTARVSIPGKGLLAHASRHPARLVEVPADYVLDLTHTGRGKGYGGWEIASLPVPAN
jgi:hypothetical protein